LEHLTNPIKSLKEWMRVIRPGGIIFLFLPHRERGNDRFRDVTPLSHLIDDYEKNISDEDGTHLEDWWNHVVEKGLMPDHYRHLKKEDLIKTGSIHHHVFTEKEIVDLFRYLKLEIIFVDPMVYDRRDSFLVIAKKIDN
jgi:SAM-dependent methyltransferase